MKWLSSQSDTVHSLLAVGTAGALLPVLPSLSPSMLATTNLVAVSAQLGSQIYVAGVSGPTMFLNMQRSDFGDIQSRLFPKYGMVGLTSGMLALTSYHLAHNRVLDVCSYLLVGSLGVYILNSFLIFPVTTKYMYQLREAKAADKNVKEAGMRFGIWHGISNLLNLASLVANLGYVYVIGSRIAGAW